MELTRVVGASEPYTVCLSHAQGVVVQHTVAGAVALRVSLAVTLALRKHWVLAGACPGQPWLCSCFWASLCQCPAPRCRCPAPWQCR